jgi:hypothetical protein
MVMIMFWGHPCRNVLFLLAAAYLMPRSFVFCHLSATFKLRCGLRMRWDWFDGRGFKITIHRK